LVIGSGGAGKSTFSRALGALTGLPVIHLDRYYWKAQWQPTSGDAWKQTVVQLASGDGWIMDGNYGGTLSLRLARCDAVVFFDFPRLACFCGVIKRRLASRGGTRSDMAEGCPERITLEFVRWIWRYPRVGRLRVLRELEVASQRIEIITVTSRKEVQSVLQCDTAPYQPVAADGE
jgi:adenylate kinase family enzyme